MTTKDEKVLARCQERLEDSNVELKELSLETCMELGEKAIELLMDYPLYISSSGITYEEAIGIAMFMFGDIDEEFEQRKELNV